MYSGPKRVDRRIESYSSPIHAVRPSGVRVAVGDMVVRTQGQMRHSVTGTSNRPDQVRPLQLPQNSGRHDSSIRLRLEGDSASADAV